MSGKEYEAGQSRGRESSPPFVPVYAKPDTPGIRMNFDNTVSIYLKVESVDTFETAAQRLFALLRETRDRFPSWPRVLYVEVEGHAGPQHGFDADFFEFQQEFVFATVAPFLTAISMPLLSVVNPHPQRDDLPERLSIHT